MTGSSMTVIVPVPRLNVPRLELGMTQLPLSQVVCVSGAFSGPSRARGNEVLLAPALCGLVEVDGDREAVGRAGGQFPDVQGGRQHGDHDGAGGDDQVVGGPGAGPGDRVELADSGVLDFEIDLDLGPERVGGQGSGVALSLPDNLAEVLTRTVFLPLERPF